MEIERDNTGYIRRVECSDKELRKAVEVLAKWVYDEDTRQVDSQGLEILQTLFRASKAREELAFGLAAQVILHYFGVPASKRPIALWYVPHFIPSIELPTEAAA